MSRRLHRDRDKNYTETISRWSGRCVSFALCAYIWVMAVVYPLHLTDRGYTTIGRDKYEFFRGAALVLLLTVALPLAALGICAIYKRWQGKAKIRIRLSGTDLAVAAFLLSASLSTMLSPYRAIAWSGHEGWYIGLETLLLLLLAYVLVSCCWQYRDNVWLGFMAGAGIAFFLGICNRFYYYPLPFDVTNPAFISTLGNTNWVAGYFSVLWPVGAGLYVFATGKVYRCIAGVYTFLAMCLGVVQGSDSAFLSFVAVFYLLALLCMGRWKEYGGACLELLMAWCLAAQLMRLARVLVPKTFEMYGLGEFLTTNSLTLWLLAPPAILYVLTKRGNARFLRLMDARWAKRCVALLPLLAVLALAVLSGMGALAFDNDFGSGRGLTWRMGMQMFARMNPWQRLFGIGPDCFAEYLYSFPDLANLCYERFGDQLLKNAHNEILTMLVNVGFVGAAAYLGIFATLFARLLKSGATKPLLYVPALCVFSYLLHNMVSFTQILNLPFVILIMAVGEANERYVRICSHIPSK
ncbi:MAG: O-antigen ligase family protein [Lachnospiraceae bacterium]|jgi:hypothetical protein|nr:O-antigen ligase family protein [Lachnospiraceae bacterium]